ncbi:hypothetical protein Leryth_022263 [Lithospermum erythrorhizon]|nr:hypothetical protein Leryth_022263 [Lithospermum erythrorhizon]
MISFPLQTKNPLNIFHYHNSSNKPNSTTNNNNNFTTYDNNINYKLNHFPFCCCLKFSTLSSQNHQTTSRIAYNSSRKEIGLKKDDNFSIVNKERKKRVFFLDVNSLCYKGSTPSLQSFGYWVSLFFSQVSLTDPVIAVIDGERGNEYRQQLLPSYKVNRRKLYRRRAVEISHKEVLDVLRKCNVPVVKMEAYEADDVVASLVRQVLDLGLQTVVASPDKDFKQLLSEDVQIVMPIPELGRWSFYTVKNYIAQYNCEPQSDLSLRCILGDEVDGVPGIQHVVPEFGRKTALKLLRKHGSLEHLLSAAAVRTVGKEYAQEALTKHADSLRRNYEVLSLRRDIKINIQEEWLQARDSSNDTVILSNFLNTLSKNRSHGYQVK